MNDTLIEDPSPPPSRRKTLLKKILLVLFGLTTLIIFTLLKLPEYKIKTYLEGVLNFSLSPYGLRIVPQDSTISIFLGPSYTLKEALFFFPPPHPTVRLERIKLSPSLFRLLFGQIGGDLEIIQQNSFIHLSHSMPSLNSTKINTSFKFKKIDLCKLNILPFFTGIQGSAILDGKGSISGDYQVPSTLEGNTTINLTKILVDTQTFSGFHIPRIYISESFGEIKINKAKINIQSLQIGKPGNSSDDLHATVTGDISLNKSWEISTLNLKIQFSFSQTILKAFSLLDTLLGSGKKENGIYSFTLSGTFLSPTFAPAP